MADLVVPGIRGEIAQAIDSLMDRWQRAPLQVVLTHLVPIVQEDALPHLAAQFHMLSGVAWRRCQAADERRGLIMDAVRRHGIKGTLAGFKQAATDAGSQLVRAIVPPAKIFAGSSMTVAERNAFVERYPQLRIYPQRLAGTRVGAMIEALFLGVAIHPVATDAALRLAPQAYLYRDGVETPLQAMERSIVTSEATAVAVTEVCKPGQAGKLGFCGRPALWTARSDAAARLYRLTLDVPYMAQSETLRMVTVSAGLAPITVRYDWIAGIGEARGVHAGRYVTGHLAGSTARERIYRRYWLFDPEIDVTRRAATMHCNAGRLGMPPHHAEIAVRITGQSHARAAGRHVHGYICATGKSGLADTLEAMRQVMRASDVIDIDTAVIKPLTAGNQHFAGGTIAGSWN